MLQVCIHRLGKDKVGQRSNLPQKGDIQPRSWPIGTTVSQYHSTVLYSTVPVSICHLAVLVFEAYNPRVIVCLLHCSSSLVFIIHIYFISILLLSPLSTGLRFIARDKVNFINRSNPCYGWTRRYVTKMRGTLPSPMSAKEFAVASRPNPRHLKLAVPAAEHLKIPPLASSNQPKLRHYVTRACGLRANLRHTHLHPQ